MPIITNHCAHNEITRRNTTSFVEVGHTSQSESSRTIQSCVADILYSVLSRVPSVSDLIKHRVLGACCSDDGGRLSVRGLGRQRGRGARGRGGRGRGRRGGVALVLQPLALSLAEVLEEVCGGERYS